MHCIALHYITLHYITLHYITLHYITLQYITLPYITLHYTILTCIIAALLKARSEAEFENAEEKALLLEEDYMLGTLNDMFQAGYDTTATTLYWIIAFLVNYPQYQEALQQQIDDVVGRERLPGKIRCLSHISVRNAVTRFPRAIAWSFFHIVRNYLIGRLSRKLAGTIPWITLSSLC